MKGMESDPILVEFAAKLGDIRRPFSLADLTAIYKASLDEVPSMVVVLDRLARVLWLNRKAVAITGYSREQLIGRDWHEVVVPLRLREDSRSRFRTALSSRHGSAPYVQTILTHSSGESRLSARLAQLRDGPGSTSCMVLVASPVEGEGKTADSEGPGAGYDDLTGLPGRAMMFDLLRRALSKARRKAGYVGVIFLDVDEFKSINDTIGHHGGDVVLQTVARRLQESVRQSDVVARLGGDEFLIILPEIDDELDCEVVAEKVLELFSRPIRLGDESVSVTTSMGITIFPGDGQSENELVANADAAMYSVKAEGKNKYRFYTAEMDRSIKQHLRLESQLREALFTRRFVVLYQPIIEAHSGKVMGAEALLRWDRGDGTLVLPGEFISVVEDSGLIIPIGEMVIATACSDAATWSGASDLPLRITVNVSLRQVVSGDLPGTVRRILDSCAISPDQLEIEITESMLLYKHQFMRQQLLALHEMGVRLSLDDFGIGYSSLACLQQSPLDTVKLDSSRIESLSPDGEQLSFCTAITTLAHGLSRKVVAEGVESEGQFELARRIGIDYMQGRHLGKPVAAREFAQLLGPPHNTGKNSGLTNAPVNGNE